MASGEKEEDIFEEFEQATPEPNKEQSQGPSKPSSASSQHHDIPVTEEELEFRRQFESKDVLKEFKKQLCCTVCGNNMYNAIVNGGEVTHHILLEILQCRNCKDYYECGEFSMDEDGTDKYCRWCGAGLTLYCCSECLFGFCRKCINRHFGLKKVKAIEQDDNWICYVCNVKPLWHLRMICYYAKLHAKNVQDKNDKQKEKKPKKSDHKLEKSKVAAEKEPCLRTEKGETSESESRNCSFSPSFPKDMPRGASGSGSDSTERNIINNNNNNNTDFFKVEDFKRQKNVVIARRKRMRPKKHLKIEKEPDKEESEKESEDEDKIKKRKRRSNVIRDSPEIEVEQPEVKDEDFPILLRTAKKDLEDMYRISLMTTELCDRAINKRLGKIKCISTYQNFCKEYSKIEKIIDCLQVHFGHVKTVIKSVKGKLEETKGKEAEI